MKKYLLHIIAFIIGAIIGVAVFRFFVPKPVPEYIEDIKKIEVLEAAKKKAVDSMATLMKKIQRDSIIIIEKHEKIRANSINGHVSDSLRASIIERGRKRFK